MYYILRDQKVVRATTAEWAEWFGSTHVVVNQEVVGDYYVSTVFVGVHDHQWWETMVWRGSMVTGDVEDCERCGGSIEQAEAMHVEMVGRLLAKTR